MGKTLLVCAAATLALLTTVPAAYASPGHHHGHGHSLFGQQRDSYSSDDSSDDSGDDSSSSDQPDTVIPSTDNTANTATGVTGGTVQSGTQQTITAEITGYSFQDNTPPGSADISMPVLHSKAGGTGTFADPITTAVPGSAGSPETAKGTRLYVAKLKRYFIVEDTGASSASSKHFDLWVDGQGFSKSASDACMNSYTGSAQIIVNPPAGEPVTVGPLTGSNGCRI